MEVDAGAQLLRARLVCEQVLKTYFGSIKSLKCNVGPTDEAVATDANDIREIHAGWKINVKYTEAQNDARFDRVWRKIIDLIDSLSGGSDCVNASVTLGVVGEIPHIRDLPDSVVTEAMLPNFKILEGVKSDYKTRNVEVRNDHTPEGKVSVPLASYVHGRALRELNPKFLTNPYLMILSILECFNSVKEIYPYLFTDCSLFQAFKNHLNKVALRGDTYHSILRLSNKRVVSWGEDAYFLKRCSVFLNFTAQLIAQSEYIKMNPLYLPVLNEVACYMFSSPLMNTAKFKRHHSTILLNSYFCTRKMKPRFSIFTIGGEPIKHERFGEAYVHRHPMYDYSPEDSTLVNRTYTKHHICTGCNREPNLWKVFEIKRKRHAEGVAGLAALGLSKTRDFAQRMAVCPENAFGLLTSVAWNALIGMSGFSTSDATIGTANKVAEMAEYNIKSTSPGWLKDDDDVKIRDNIQARIRRSFFDLTRIAVDNGFYPRAERFRETIPNILTGKSAGIGTLKFTVNGRQISVTDKKSWALVMGNKITNLDSSEFNTSSFKDWMVYYASYGGDPTRIKGSPLRLQEHPLVQMSIALREVPGARDPRYVYMQPVGLYLIERALFAWVEMTNTRPKTKHAFNKWSNAVDQGNTSVAPNLQDTDDFLCGPVMASADPNRLMFCIDYSAYDQGETWRKVLYYAMSGMADYFKIGPQWFKDTYLLIDNKPSSLHDALAFYIQTIAGRYFNITMMPSVIEILVDFLTSGAYFTFATNTEVNEDVTQEMEEYIASLVALFTGFNDTCIAGDDNIFSVDISALTKEDIVVMKNAISKVANAIGFKENVDKTDLSLNTAEMAKIFMYLGMVARIGSVQLFESEKESRATTVFESIRGFHQLVKIFMLRYPADTQLLSFVALVMGTVTGQLDTVDKKLTNTREILIMDPYIQVIPSSIGCGCGATMTGVMNNELLYHYYSAHQQEFLCYCDLASKIKFQRLDTQQKSLVNSIMGKIRNEETLPVTLPNGKVILEGMRGAKDLLAVHTQKLNESISANAKLLEMNIRIPKNMTIATATQSYIEQITASLEIDATVLKSDSAAFIANIESYLIDRARAKQMIGRLQPLMMNVYMQATNVPVEPPKEMRVTRYPTVSNGLFRVLGFMSDRHSKLAPKNPALLSSIIVILNAARHETVISSNVVEETFLDLILDVITSVPKGASSLYSILTLMLQTMFGKLVNEHKYVMDLLRTINSNQVVQIPYSLSGSFLVYLDLEPMERTEYLQIPARSVYHMHYTHMGTTIFLSRIAAGITPSVVALNNLDMLRKDITLMPIARAYSIKSTYPSHEYVAYE